MGDAIKIEKIDLDLSSRYGSNPLLYKLNMPVIKVFEEIGVGDRFEFNEKLAEKLGIENNFLLIALEKDIETYEQISKYFTPFEDYIGPKGKEELYSHVINYIINMVYVDLPFGNVGNLGLKDLNGNTIVPPLFNSVAGAEDFIFYKTLCVVEKQNKFYLTPRDGSGKLMSEGFDKISRSYCYAWVKRNSKYGLLDSRTGDIIVPCEMDIMTDSGGRGSWLIGKDNMIGIISHGFGQIGSTKAVLPQFDYVDLTTGQFCKNGELGWLLADGTFIHRPPRRNEGYIHLNGGFPLSYNYDRLVYKIEDKNTNKRISGFKKIKRRRWSISPEKRLTIPDLIIEDKDQVVPHPKVETLFEGLHFYNGTNSPYHLTLEDNGMTIHCKTIKHELSKWDISISCELIDEEDIAIMEAFPLTLGCNKILKCRGNKFILQLKRNFQDFFLAKAFLSALLYFRLSNRILK